MDVVEPIPVTQGDDIFWDVTLTDDDGTVDLRGYTWAASWKSRPKSTVSVPIALDTSLLEQGKISFHLTNEQTSAMDRNGFWSLRSTSADGVVRTWVSGTTLFEDGVY